MALSQTMSSRRLRRWYLAKCRHRRSEEYLGTDDPYTPKPDPDYVEAGTWYMLPNVVPNRGPGGYLSPAPPVPPVPPPVLMALFPANGTLGGGWLQLEVDGQDFVFGAQIVFATFPQANTTFQSTHRLTCMLAPSYLTIAGAYMVVVQNPDGQTSFGMNFTVS